MPTDTPIFALLLSLSCSVTLLSLDAVTLRSLAAFKVTFSPSTLLPLILISSSVEVIVTSPSALILLPWLTMVVLSLSLSLCCVPKPMLILSILSLAFPNCSFVLAVSLATFSTALSPNAIVLFSKISNLPSSLSILLIPFSMSSMPLASSCPAFTP